MEVGVSLGFGKWIIVPKMQRELREIRGSGILMNKEKRGGVLARAPTIFLISFGFLLWIVNL